MKKKIIAVDCDEVLSEFLTPMVKFYNRVHQEEEEADKTMQINNSPLPLNKNRKRRINFDDFHSFHFSDVWGGTDEETEKIVELFFQSNEFKNCIPIRGALEGLQKLKQKYRLVVVTSRQTQLIEITHKFLQKYFAEIFEDVFFGNHYGTSGPKYSKPQLIKSAGAELLIDDSVAYVNQCAQEGIKAILFGEYPWNSKFSETEKLTKRAKDWDEVIKCVEELFNVEATHQETQNS